MELIIGFVLGILIGAVIFSLVYSVTGILKIKKQIVIHKEYQDALSHNIDAVNDHLTKMIDDVKRTITDEINGTNTDLKNSTDNILSRIEDTELMFDTTIGKVIDNLQDNINTVEEKTESVRKYVDSRIDKLGARKKPAVEYFTDEEIKQETQQLNS